MAYSGLYGESNFAEILDELLGAFLHFWFIWVPLIVIIVLLRWFQRATR